MENLPTPDTSASTSVQKDKINIYILWTLLLGSLLGAVAALAAGLLSDQGEPKDVFLASATLFGFFLVTAVLMFFMRRQFDPSVPGLLLSPERFIFDPVNDRGLAWGQIQGFDLKRTRNGKQFIVRLHEPEQAYALARNSAERAGMRLGQKLWGGPVNVATNALKIEPERLLALAQAYHARYGTPRG